MPARYLPIKCSINQGHTRFGIDDDVSESSSSSVVILNSMLIGDSSLNRKSSIGHGSVIEHCTILATDGGKIEVGQRCLLSGIRGNLMDKQLSVPSEMCLQMLPLLYKCYPYEMEKVLCAYVLESMMISRVLQSCMEWISIVFWRDQD